MHEERRAGRQGVWQGAVVYRASLPCSQDTGLSYTVTRQYGPSTHVDGNTGYGLAWTLDLARLGPGLDP